MNRTGESYKYFIILILFFNSSLVFAVSTYHIGNSLTWDAINAGAMVDLFSKGGITLSQNHHVRCGSSLTSTLSSPNDPCNVSGDGNWNEALSKNSYDYLILQPHEGSSTTSEISAIESFLSLTSAQLIIFEAYPGKNAAFNIDSFYQRPNQDPFQQSLVEFAEIRHAFPNALVIPAMEVLLKLDSKARNGEISGMSTAQDFYRDSRHLNNFGKYALGLTHYAVLTGLDPSHTGLDLHTRYSDVTDEQALIIQTVVSEVVSVTSSVPLPTGIWLMGSGLLGLIGYSRTGKGQHK